MANTSGHAQIAFMEAGSLATTPAGVILLGITRNENLKVTDFRTTKIERDDFEIPNEKNLMLSAETLQPSLYMFNKLLTYKGGNCDIQIITLNGRVFKFPAATNPLGIKPTFIINDDYRSIKVDVEASFPLAVWNAIELAAASATAVTLATPQSGRDGTKRKNCHPVFTQCPSTTELFAKYTKRSLEIAPKEKTRAHISGTNSKNIALFDRLTITGIFQTDDATHLDHYNLNGKGMFPELWLKDNNAGAYYDLIKFAAGTLQLITEYENAETKSTLTATFKGAIPLENMALTVDNGTGDSDAGTGINGGTLTFT